MSTFIDLLQLHETNSENIESDLSTMKSRQILSDSTNTPSENSQNNTSIQPTRRRRQSSLTLATIRRYKETSKRKTPSDKIVVDMEMLNNIQKFQQNDQQHSLNEQEQLRIQQRALYNARQTPLIPLVADVDFSLLSELSEEQDVLLMDIISLINNIDKECSFYEQFQI